MSNLTTLRDRVESLLKDAGNARWAAGELDDAIRRALARYTERRPLEKITALTFAADGRELALGGIGDLLRPLRVWYPYTASAPEYPPLWVAWERHGPAMLFLDVAAEPQAGDVARLFYAAPHTVDGLDGASATTLQADEEETLTLGAAGYAALARAAYVHEAVTLSGQTPSHWRAWAEAALQAFERQLAPRYEPARWPTWE